MALDPMESLFWHMIAGTKGGPNRLFILSLLCSRPYNANQITQKLKLDYKTVRHHLEILVSNGLIYVSKEPRYGELYHVNDFAREKVKKFDHMIKKIDDGDLGQR